MTRVLVTGASGMLGGYLVRQVSALGHPLVAWAGRQTQDSLQCVDLADADAVKAAFRAAAPSVVLHAAALARIGDCFRDPDRAWLVNAGGTALLAELCAEANSRLVLVSTDLVFDGEHAPYRESDPPTPLSVYAKSKVAAEQAALTRPGNSVARVSLLFGPSGQAVPSFFDDQVRALREGREITLFEDEWRTPLDLTTAANALVELALADGAGISHLGGPERLSRLDMGHILASVLGVSPDLVRPNRRDDVPAAEPRPRDTSLDSSRWREAFPRSPWPGYEEALRGMLQED
jgi:dTDP-4-dehydrorhamnose reductase